MPRARANGIDIEYEAIGDPNDAPLLLVMGLGAQLITWDDEFCVQLAARGFHIIRYDNRDSGLSTHLDAAGPPDRALSLTSIMSGPGGRDEVAPWPEGAEVLTRIPPETREGRIENAMWIRRVLNGKDNPFDEAVELGKATRPIDRAYYPSGTGRQLVAILAAKSRMERLRGVEIPTLVVHGVDDPLVPVENGRLVADAVPGARLLELEGMGHNMPEHLWPEVIDAIVETAGKASPVQPGAAWSS